MHFDLVYIEGLDIASPDSVIKSLLKYLASKAVGSLEAAKCADVVALPW